MEEQLFFEVEKVGDVAVVRLGPRLDIQTVPDVRRRIKRVIDSGDKVIVIDMRRIEYISSFGLSMLLTLAKELSNRGGNLFLAQPRETARELLQLTRLQTILPTYDTLREAIDAAADAAGAPPREGS